MLRGESQEVYKLRARHEVFVASVLFVSGDRLALMFQTPPA